MNAIIFARKSAVEAVKAAAKEEIEAIEREYYTEIPILEAAAEAKRIIDTATTTAEVETAKAKGLEIVHEAIIIFTGVVDIADENAKEPTVVYNINGSRVSSVSAPGMYIINNKKVFIRK